MLYYGTSEESAITRNSSCVLICGANLWRNPHSERGKKSPGQPLTRDSWQMTYIIRELRYASSENWANGKKIFLAPMARSGGLADENL